MPLASEYPESKGNIQNSETRAIRVKQRDQMKKPQEKESRLDRIESGLELLLQGTSELKESQKKTDEQILELKESQKKTDAQIQKTDAQIQKTGAQIQETGELLQKTIKKLDEIGRQLGDLGLVQGEVAEDLPCYPFRCALSPH